MKSNAPNRLSQFLFHPFHRVAGMSSLLLGLAAILLAGGIGFRQNLHFDGVLDAHVGGKTPLWVALAEGLINWLSLTVLLLIAGKSLSKTAFRVIDLMGTQALARWPMLLVSLGCLAPGFHRYTDALVMSLQTIKPGATTFALPPMGWDGFVFAIVTIVMLACTVWMVALMWKSFSHCCNLRGGKAVGAFAVSLLLAEILSKMLIGFLFQWA